MCTYFHINIQLISFVNVVINGNGNLYKYY